MNALNRRTLINRRLSFIPRGYCIQGRNAGVYVGLNSFRQCSQGAACVGLKPDLQGYVGSVAIPSGTGCADLQGYVGSVAIPSGTGCAGLKEPLFGWDLNLVFSDALIQRRSGDIENQRRPFFLVAGVGQDVLDVLTLHLLERFNLQG